MSHSPTVDYTALRSPPLRPGPRKRGRDVTEIIEQVISKNFKERDDQL